MSSFFGGTDERHAKKIFGQCSNSLSTHRLPLYITKPTGLTTEANFNLLLSQGADGVGVLMVQVQYE